MAHKFTRLIAICVVMAIFISLFSASPLNAQGVADDACRGASSASICSAGSDDPITGSDGIIMRVVGLLSYAIGFISVVMIIVAGIKFSTSGGNPESVASARNTVIYSLVGLAVAVSARLIVSFIVSLI